MMNRIMKIGIPYLEDLEGTDETRLCAELFIDNQKIYTLWYQTNVKYRPYLCTERSDAFVVTLLLYAMEHSLDIDCRQAMSERLYYQLVEYMIPCIQKNISMYHPIQLSAPTISEPLGTEGAVGASLSGGVDSFYTLLRNLERKENTYNVSHLTFFNAGASGEYGGERARKRYIERIEWIKDVAERLQKEMLCVDSNMNEFLMEMHVATHSFRTLSIPLAFQKLFSKYYFSSGFSYSDFSFNSEDSSYYDLLTVQCLSTENLSFYSSGGESNRQEKISYISKYPITYSRLNVCVAKSVNCSRCEKCERTMMGLYAQDKLELYKSVFDVDYFYTHKKKYLLHVIAYRNRHDWNEIYGMLKRKNELGLEVLLLGNLNYIYQVIRKAASKQKVLRKAYEIWKNKCDQYRTEREML